MMAVHGLIKLKPHPSCKKGGEIIDIFEVNGEPLPWCNTHIDLFYQSPFLYSLLYTDKAEIEVEIIIKRINGELLIDTKDGESAAHSENYTVDIPKHYTEDQREEFRKRLREYAEEIEAFITVRGLVESVIKDGE